MKLGIFVTGTDTGVGKTRVSGGLLCAFNDLGHAAYYWKPIQSGTDESDDTETVRTLTGLPDSHFGVPSYRFRAPVSPHLAAARENTVIDPQRILADASDCFATEGIWIVEGAGGLLVPLNPDYLMMDLISALGLPVLLVAPDRLGVINHALLALQACRSRDIPIHGFVLNYCDSPQSTNEEAIEQFGNTSCLGNIPNATGSSQLPDLRGIAQALLPA